MDRWMDRQHHTVKRPIYNYCHIGNPFVDFQERDHEADTISLEVII